MSMLEQAPASAAAGRGTILSNFGPWALLQRLFGLVQALRSRKTVMNMREFDDAQLADIGLRRGDVETALSQPLGSDPLRYLALTRRDPLRGLRHS